MQLFDITGHLKIKVKIVVLLKYDKNKVMANDIKNSIICLWKSCSFQSKVQSGILCLLCPSMK